MYERRMKNMIQALTEYWPSYRGVTTNPTMWEAVGLWGHKIMALIFFAENFTGQFLCRCALQWLGKRRGPKWLPWVDGTKFYLCHCLLTCRLRYRIDLARGAFLSFLTVAGGPRLKKTAPLCLEVKLKGELNPKIKLDLNNSFCPLINKYNPHIF